MLDAINTNSITGNSKLDDIKSTQTNGSQQTKVMGNNSGSQVQIKVDANGTQEVALSNNSVKIEALRSDTGAQTSLKCTSDGELEVSNSTNKSNGSEVSYVSGQAISGSGTHTGASISISPNTEAIFLEHNFSNSSIAYTMQASIDGTNFFDTPNVFNSVGATTTGINLANGIGVSGGGFTPHIRFKFTDTSGSSQTISLSYMLQSS
jgi:hypothetical protein